MLLGMVAILAASSDVLAEDVPDPFVAYEQAEEPDDDSAEARDAPPDPPPKAAEERVDSLEGLIAADTWQLSTGTSVSYDRSTNELLDGDDATNSTYLFRLNLGLGHYLLDRVLIEGTAGFMVRRLARQGGASSTEQDWVFQARAWYILPLTNRLGLMTGLGLGGYVGSSTRQFRTDETTLNEDTTTVGLAGDLMVGTMFTINDTDALRVLLDFTLLRGNEKVRSLDESLRVRASHFGLSLGYSHSF